MAAAAEQATNAAGGAVDFEQLVIAECAAVIRRTDLIVNIVAGTALYVAGGVEQHSRNGTTIIIWQPTIRK